MGEHHPLVAGGVHQAAALVDGNLRQTLLQSIRLERSSKLEAQVALELDNIIVRTLSRILAVESLDAEQRHRQIRRRRAHDANGQVPGHRPDS